MMVAFFAVGKTSTALGAGDLKLLMAIALICSWPNIISAIFIMAITMASYCLLGLASGKLKINSYFPMCGFIMFGMIVSILPFLAQAVLRGALR